MLTALRDIKQMRDSGTISEEDYDARKKKLIDKRLSLGIP
jgi:hypothetical protein